MGNSKSQPTLDQATYRKSGYGNRYNSYYKGKLHSFNDEPAEYDGVYKIWYNRGIETRDGDKPSRISSEVWEYRCGGIPHRDHGKPAVIHTNGKLVWYQEGFVTRTEKVDPSIVDIYRRASV